MSAATDKVRGTLFALTLGLLLVLMVMTDDDAALAVHLFTALWLIEHRG